MKNSKLFKYIQIFSICVLLIVFAMEYLLHFSTCDLCILQRFLWGLLILTTLLFSSKKLVIIVISSSILISIYHLLISYKLMNNTVCKINIDTEAATFVNDCTHIDLFLFLPLPLYNLVINIILLVFVVIKFKSNDNE